MRTAEKKPFVWQTECLDRWLDNQGRGIVHVVTGAGKTFLALKAISALEKSALIARNVPLRVKIVVPKTFLMYQWANALKSELGVSNQQIGYYCGTHKELGDKEIMIYVINSARHTLSRQILQDLRGGGAVLLIADECHHYASEENFRIFDFFPYLPDCKGKFFSLGLSATPETSADNRSLEPYLGKEIFAYGFSQALRSKIISDFSIFRIGVDFSPDELADYTDLSDSVVRCLGRLKALRPALRQADSSRFFALLQKLTLDSNPDIAALAQAALSFIYQRREVVYLAQARIPCVTALISELRPDSKIIVFGERVESADSLYRRLCKAFPGQVGRYHSKMSDVAKKFALNRYQNAEIRILVSCKALDEGLNVPQTDVGIILSETASARQRIQRLGRILRKGDENRTACLYTLYVRQAGKGDESGEAPAGLDGFDTTVLGYNSDREEFTAPLYEQLCDRVSASLLSQNTSEALLSQVWQNMRLGVVRNDFLRPEQDCLARVRTASTKAERNYWITMLLISRANAEVQT